MKVITDYVTISYFENVEFERERQIYQPGFNKVEFMIGQLKEDEIPTLNQPMHLFSSLHKRTLFELGIETSKNWSMLRTLVTDVTIQVTSEYEQPDNNNNQTNS